MTGSNPQASPGAASATVRCPNVGCRRHLAVTEESRGRTAYCPHCGTAVRVPGELPRPELYAASRLCQIRVKRGPAFEGRRFALEPQRRYSIGRADHCDIQLPSETVARHHAELAFVGGAWVLEDLGSRNGIRVQGSRVHTFELRSLETFQVGEFLLEFSLPQDAHPPADEPPAAPLLAVTGPPLAVAPSAPTQTASTDAPDPLLAARTTPMMSEPATPRALRIALLGGVTIVLLAAGVYYVTLRITTSLKPGAPVETGQRRVQVLRSNSPAEQPAATPDFAKALERHDFEAAQREIDAERGAAKPRESLLRDMQANFDRQAQRYNTVLLQKARSAALSQKWDELESTLREARAPAFARFHDDWVPLEQSALRGRVLPEVNKLKESGKLSEALALLNASALPPSPELDAARSGLLAQLGAGLKITAKPPEAEVALRIADRCVGHADETLWGLTPGAVTLTVSADGYLSQTLSLNLRPGELLERSVKLEAGPSEAQWTLHVLRNAQTPSALWLGSLLLKDRLPAGAKGGLDDVERAARRALPREPLVVGELNLRNGEKLTAVVTKTSNGYSCREIPSGKIHQVATDQVRRLTEYPPAAAARALYELDRAEHDTGRDAIDVLERIGAIVLRLNCGDELRQESEELLAEVSRACPRCAGRRTSLCTACAGKRKTAALATCESCKGSGKLSCARCHGTARMACSRCGGSGKERGPDEHKGIWVSKTWRTCSRCSGSGEESCTRCTHSGQEPCMLCSGTGRAPGKIECSNCKARGIVECPLCGGHGDRMSISRAEREREERAAVALK